MCHNEVITSCGNSLDILRNALDAADDEIALGSEII
jgi:hypothetical protein